MSRLRIPLLVPALLALLPCCAAGPAPVKEAAGKPMPAVSISLPRSPVLQAGPDSFHGVVFQEYLHTATRSGGAEGSFGVHVTRTGEERFDVVARNTETAGGRTGGSYIRYAVSVDAVDRGDALELSFRPADARTETGVGPAGNPLGLPDFDAEKLYRFLRSPFVELRYEAVTASSPDDLVRNMDAALRPDPYFLPDPSFAGTMLRYKMIHGTRQAVLTVEIVPSPPGCRAVITTKLLLTAGPDGRVDGREQINAFVDALDRIVKR